MRAPGNETHAIAAKTDFFSCAQMQAQSEPKAIQATENCLLNFSSLPIALESRTPANVWPRMTQAMEMTRSPWRQRMVESDTVGAVVVLVDHSLARFQLKAKHLQNFTKLPARHTMSSHDITAANSSTTRFVDVKSRLRTTLNPVFQI